MEVNSKLCDTMRMPVKPQYPQIKIEPMEDFDLPSFMEKLRKQIGLERREMALILGVSYGAYEHYEMGRRSIPGQVVAKLYALRDKLSIPSINPETKSSLNG